MSTVVESLSHRTVQRPIMLNPNPPDLGISFLQQYVFRSSTTVADPVVVFLNDASTNLV